MQATSSSSRTNLRAFAYQRRHFLGPTFSPPPSSPSSTPCRRRRRRRNSEQTSTSARGRAVYGAGLKLRRGAASSPSASRRPVPLQAPLLLLPPGLPDGRTDRRTPPSTTAYPRKASICITQRRSDDDGGIVGGIAPRRRAAARCAQVDSGRRRRR